MLFLQSSFQNKILIKTPKPDCLFCYHCTKVTKSCFPLFVWTLGQGLSLVLLAVFIFVLCVVSVVVSQGNQPYFTLTVVVFILIHMFNRTFNNGPRDFTELTVCYSIVIINKN